MNISLKALTPKVKEVSTGVINLASQAGPLVKHSLFCYVGTFDGMYGEVEVTKDLLKGIADKYNLIKKDAQNENDYAPILVDHDRKVDLIKGRVLSGLVIEPWFNPETKEETLGLFGDLRIDDDEAKKNVASGKYAHLSISFDEETFDLFEISFVAVEAARGAIVLSQSKGGSMDLKHQLSKLSQKHRALAQHTKAARKNRKEQLAQLITKKTEVSNEITALMAKMSAISLSVKTGQMKTRFSEFVSLGKMNPVELKKIDFKELATLSDSSLKIVLSSYENRAVSTDVFQHGQSSDKKVSIQAMSPEQMREAIKLQQSGKGASLAASDKEEEDDKNLSEDEKEKKALAEKEAGELKSYSMGKEDWDKCLEEMGGMHSKLSELIEKVKGMGADAEKMSEGEDKDEVKEKDLEAKDDDNSDD